MREAEIPVDWATRDGKTFITTLMLGDWEVDCRLNTGGVLDVCIDDEKDWKLVHAFTLRGEKAVQLEVANRILSALKTYHEFRETLE